MTASWVDVSYILLALEEKKYTLAFLVTISLKEKWVNSEIVVVPAVLSIYYLATWTYYTF